MTERVSCGPSRNVSRREEEEEERSKEASSSGAPPQVASQARLNDKPAPTCRDRQVSQPPIDWDSVPSMCDANAVEAARNAIAGGMSGGTRAGVPMTSPGKAPEQNASTSPPPSPPPKPPVKTAGASTNAARTTERDFLKGPYAAAGITHDGGSLFAGAAALKGRTTEGIEAEALGVSVQVGRQTEAQSTVARLGYSSKHVSGSVEALTANAHFGFDNSDGSVGVNIGAGATLASAEITAKHSGWSITRGISAGPGGEAHIGLRDDDKDGRPELCVRVGWAFVIAGSCVESPIILKP